MYGTGISCTVLPVHMTVRCECVGGTELQREGALWISGHVQRLFSSMRVTSMALMTAVSFSPMVLFLPLLCGEKLVMAIQRSHGSFVGSFWWCSMTRLCRTEEEEPLDNLAGPNH